MHNLTTKQIRPGDIFVSNWGYSMTLASFYEVAKVSASGKTVTYRALRKLALGPEDAAGSVKVMPVAGEYEGAPRSRRLKVYDGRAFFTPAHHENAYLWDGTAQTENHYD